MTKLRYVELYKEIHSPAFPERSNRIGESPHRTILEPSQGVTLEFVPELHSVRITGEYGTVLVPWSGVLYAREEQPSTETAKAAAPSRGARGAR